MDLVSTGLKEQPFCRHGAPLLTVPYAAHREALKALRQVDAMPDGMVLLQAPALAGKSTIVQRFIETRDAKCAIAVIDGSGLDTLPLLEAILYQFGYELDYNSANELFAMLRVFALQQTARHEPPLLIVDNAHALKASALQTICELAELRMRQPAATRTNALKFVLVSDRSLRSITSDKLLEPILQRVSADVHLQPMTGEETTYYLQQKLKAAGSAIPEYVLSLEACKSLHTASGGWPGVVDRLALLAIAKAKTLPIAADIIEQPVLPQGNGDDTGTSIQTLAPGEPPEPPKLIVSKNGKPLRAIMLDRPRLIVGRSEHNDIAIPSRFVSRHHLLLVRHGSATFLMDLNSVNGTLVNSRRVSNHVLMHNDVISIAQYRIKFYDPHATTRGSLDGAEFADTSIMKTLDDMRKLLAQEEPEETVAATADKTASGSR